MIKIPVIYILSNGHSGSTLLDLMLGSHSSIESAGEMSKLWTYTNPESTRTDKRCTCGAEFTKCDYWNKVNSIADLNYIGNPDAEEEFAERNSTLIDTILKVSNKLFFCDSSKSTLRLDNYLKCTIFDVKIIHLVRDGRAVAYSGILKNNRLLTNSENKHEYEKYFELNKKHKKQYSYFESIKKWKNSNNDYVEKYSHHPNYFLLKYEKLAENPEKELSLLMNKLGLNYEGNQLIFNSIHHNIAGNRMRRNTGQKIARDVKYLKELKFAEWWLSTIYLMPELINFKYPLSRK